MTITSGRAAVRISQRARRLVALSAALACAASPAPANAIAPPNDPLYAQQVAPGGALAIMRQPEALATVGRTTLQDVLVTNLDTGLDLVNPDIASRLTRVAAGTAAPLRYGAAPPPGPTAVPAGGSFGWDMLGHALQNANTLPDADPTDPAGQSGHGTAVAGVLGQASNNAIGGAGVAPNARFLAMRSCWDNDVCYQSIQADATAWAVARGVRVVSMSWLAGPPAVAGGPWGDGFDNAIRNAPDTLFVAIPGGNGGAALAGDERRPCGDPASNILCVSTSSPSDGLDCGEFNPTMVDLAVPTQNNVTTYNGAGSGPTGCATSYAAPTAAGAATVLFGLDPSATPAVVKQALVESARPSPAWQGKSVSGGILDLDAAVKLFAQRRGITLVPDGATTALPLPNPGPGPGRGPGPVPDKTAPVLSALSLSRARLNTTSGATLTVALSEPASLTMSLTRAVRGARVSRRCLARTHARRRAASCTRRIKVAAIHLRNLKAGTTRLRFRARNDAGRRLAPGRYRASVVAVDAAGNTSSPPRKLTFKVVPRR